MGHYLEKPLNIFCIDDAPSIVENVASQRDAENSETRFGDCFWYRHWFRHPFVKKGLPR